MKLTKWSHLKLNGVPPSVHFLFFFFLTILLSSNSDITKYFLDTRSHTTTTTNEVGTVSTFQLSSTLSNLNFKRALSV